LFFSFSNEQSIGTFNSIQPTTQTQNLVLPSTHTFQKIIQSGDLLTSGGSMGDNLDFSGYVPINGNSKNGYLSVSSETTPAECAILTLAFNNVTGLWGIQNSGKVNFPQSEIGDIKSFCSGTVTPNNTIMVCEESLASGDANNDGYQDHGWVIEIDPSTRTVINQDGIGGVDKLWALGREQHENVAIKKDNSALYWGADNTTTGYIYKFIPLIPGNFSSGLLYVLQTSSSFGTGTWKLINNTTQSDRNNTSTLSTAAGAYNFNRIEDVEIGPDGKIYFSATADGVIYRFNDLGNGNVNQLEVFVASVNYDVDGAGPFTPEPWGIGNDNLAFDGEGNLWVLQDGSRNHIWVVGATHTAASPKIKLFATTPFGSEPTGITFTPDYKFMFLSIQHPATSNSVAQTDIANNNVLFNKHTTIVIARKESFLDAIPLPLKLTGFDATFHNDRVQIKWSASEAYNHSYFEIERSENGIDFKSIYRNTEEMNSGTKSFMQFDNDLPDNNIIYYRIKQCDRDNQCHYSNVKAVHLIQNKTVIIYPVPVRETLNITYHSVIAKKLSFQIINNTGALQLQKIHFLKKGDNKLTLSTKGLNSGNYYLVTTGGEGQQKIQSFVKVK
jgi:secreted PhoX family phosphatase